jgi:hypothetical protein
MIDRANRQRAREILEHFVNGELTNDEFEAEFPADSPDKVLGEIYQRLWFLWDDRFEHRLVGEHALNDDNRAMVARLIAFLDSDTEYCWPDNAVMARFPLTLSRLFGLRKAAESIEREQLDQLRDTGNIDAWPFVSMEHYAAASARIGKPCGPESGG